MFFSFILSGSYPGSIYFSLIISRKMLIELTYFFKQEAYSA